MLKQPVAPSSQQQQESSTSNVVEADFRAKQREREKQMLALILKTKKAAQQHVGFLRRYLNEE